MIYKKSKLSKKNRIKKGGSAGYKPSKRKSRMKNETGLCDAGIVSQAISDQIDDYNEIISTIHSLRYEYPIMNASNTYPLVKLDDVLNPAEVEMLVGMGFPEARVKKALVLTGGFDQAMAWMLDHRSDPDVDNPLCIYNYEENLADGNCLYYSIIRSMERNIYPQENPLDTDLELGDFNGNHLLTPEGIRKFKEHIREHSRENTELMDTPIVNPTSGTVQNLMDDTVFGENLATQATANYLNCCIFVLVPKGTNLGAGYVSNSDSWSVYYPDSADRPSRPINLFGTDFFPSRDGETPSHLSLTNDFSPDELVYIKQKSGKECAHEDYKKDTQSFRNTRKEQAIKDFIEARRICRNQIFIMNKDNGHFVSIEPNDHSKKDNFLLKPYYDRLVEETSSPRLSSPRLSSPRLSSSRLSSPRVSTSNSTIKTKSNSKKKKIKFVVKSKSGLSKTDISDIKKKLKKSGVEIDNESLTQMLNAFSTKEEALRTLLFR